MKYALSANSQLEEVPDTATFNKGLFVFNHPKHGTIILLPAGNRTNVPIVYTYHNNLLSRGSHTTWTRTIVQTNVSSTEQAVELVFNDVNTNIPESFNSPCRGCGN